MILEIATRNLIEARRRSMFLGMALALVTMLLVLLLALSQGLTETMIHSATTLASGHVNVSGFFKASAGDAAPMITDRDTVRKIVEENTPGLDFIIDRHRGWARVVSETSSLQAGLTGVELSKDPQLAATLRMAPRKDYVENGADEVAGDISRLEKPGTALIFAAQAKRLGVDVGDNLTVTVETLAGMRNTSEVTVIGVAKDIGMMSAWSVFVNRETILELYRLKPDTTGAVMVYLQDIDDAPAAMEKLRVVFQEKGYEMMEHEPIPFYMKFQKVSGEDWLGQKLDLTVWRDEVALLTWVLTAVDTTSFFLIGVLLVIIVVGIMNSMYISVRERTREIGTVRAIGMGKGAVLMMFMTEAILLGLVSTGAGALAGAAIAAIVDAAQIHIPIEAVQAVLMSDTVHLVVRPLQLLAAVLTFTAVTALAALWPALRAARLQPVAAMQSVT